MGNYFILVNFTRKEYVRFSPSKEFEILGNKVQAQLVAFYLWDHNGDLIAFLGDEWQVGSPPLEAYTLGRERIRKEWKDATQENIESFNEFVVQWSSPEQQIKVDSLIQTGEKK